MKQPLKGPHHFTGITRDAMNRLFQRGITVRNQSVLQRGVNDTAEAMTDLVRRLEQNSFAAWLPEGWKDAGNNLSAGSLGELAVLIQREIATQSSRAAPSVQHLSNVLAEIGRLRGLLTRDIGTPGHDSFYGAGLVDAAAALAPAQ